MEGSGYIAILVAIVGGRIINERGFRLLSDMEKLRLMDGFSNARAYAMLPLVGLTAIYYFLATKTELNPEVVSGIYFLLLAAFLVALTVFNHRRIDALNLPERYRRLFLLSQVISLAGVGWFFSLSRPYQADAISECQQKPRQGEQDAAPQIRPRRWVEGLTGGGSVVEVVKVR